MSELKRWKLYSCRFEWKLEDFWVGLFWRRSPRMIELWFCLLPCVPLYFVFIPRKEAKIR